MKLKKGQLLGFLIRLFAPLFFQLFVAYFMYELVVPVFAGFCVDDLNSLLAILDGNAFSVKAIMGALFYSFKICVPLWIVIGIYEFIVRKLFGFSREEAKKSFEVIEKVAEVVLAIIALISLYYTAIPKGVSGAAAIDGVNFIFSVEAFYVNLSLVLYMKAGKAWTDALSEDVNLFEI